MAKHRTYTGFKYNVGDLVQAINDEKAASILPMQIIERHYQECPGGIQLHYFVRRSDKYNTGYVKYNEIELIPFIEDLYVKDDFIGALRIRKTKEDPTEAVWRVKKESPAPTPTTPQQGP
jgi:hypothetical protein